MNLGLKAYRENKELNKKMIRALIILYIIFLLWVIVFKCNNNDGLYIEANRSMTLLERLEYKKIPFIHAYQMILGGDYIEIVAFLGKIILFAPVGLGFCYFTTTKKSLLISFGITVAIEIFQLFSCWGGFEYMDIVLNMLGAIIGVLLYKPFLKIKNRLINLLALIATAILIPIDIFAIINSIIHFPGF